MSNLTDRADAYYLGYPLQGKSSELQYPPESTARSLHRRLVKLCSYGPRNHHKALWQSAAYLISQFSPKLRVSLQAVPTYEEGIGLVNRYNVIASLGPENALSVIAVSGHYDTVPGTVGADDNASGAVSVVEIANRVAAFDGVLNAGVRLDFVLFTNEEPPHFGDKDMGSYKYFTSGDQIDRVINLDCVGYPHGSDGAVYLLCHKDDTVTRDSFALRGPEYQVYKDESGSLAMLSDQRWLVGTAPAVHVNDMALTGNPNIHRPSDKPDTLSYKYMAGIVETVADIITEEYFT